MTKEEIIAKINEEETLHYRKTAEYTDALTDERIKHLARLNTINDMIAAEETAHATKMAQLNAMMDTSTKEQMRQEDALRFVKNKIKEQFPAVEVKLLSVSSKGDYHFIINFGEED